MRTLNFLRPVMVAGIAAAMLAAGASGARADRNRRQLVQRGRGQSEDRRTENLDAEYAATFRRTDGHATAGWNGVALATMRSNKLIRQSGALLNGRERHARPELTLHSKRKRGRLDAGGTAVPGNAIENRPSAMCRVHGGNVQSVCFAILKEISRYGLSTVEADSPPEFP